jgi:hypothetical protein
VPAARQAAGVVRAVGRECGELRIPVAPKADRTDPVTGIVFASKGEFVRWNELQMLVRAGAISELQRQIKFPLYASGPTGNGTPIKIRSNHYHEGRPAVCTIDFTYRENGVDIYEDWHPRYTEADRLRHAIAEACYGIQIRITGGGKLRSSKKGARKWGSSLTSSPSSGR